MIKDHYDACVCVCACACVCMCVCYVCYIPSPVNRHALHTSHTKQLFLAAASFAATLSHHAYTPDTPATLSPQVNTSSSYKYGPLFYQDLIRP